MDTVWITRECLAAGADLEAALAEIGSTGARVWTIGPDPGGARPIPAGIQAMATAREGDGSAASAVRAALGGERGEPQRICLLTGDPASAEAAEAAGCRTILVLEDRALMEVQREARAKGHHIGKHVAAAPDLATALRYAHSEVLESQTLGPSPFGLTPGAQRDIPPLPTPGDLGRIFGLVVLAGTATALAIAYFLQEIYQSFRFPPIVYWLTLQFLPDWGRGILFLLIGVAIGVLASRTLSGLSTRRARRG